jgi:hypothetical protein
LPNLYNYTFNESANTYSFSTKNNIEYKIVFIVDETLDFASDIPILNVFQIIIEKVTDDREPYDSLVSKTIENIVTTFFANTKNSLIYICSQDEERAETRFYVFDRWYKKSTLKSVKKADNIVSFESGGNAYIIYSSLLYHAENPNIKLILSAYENIERVINEK